MLFFAPEDERDEDLDEEEGDAATEDDSDEEEEEDEGDDLDDLDEEEDSDDEDSDDEEEDDDDKPVTRKELRDALKGNKNNRNASRRVKSKQRNTRQPSDDSKRLDSLEKAEQKRQLSEKKRDFGYEHGLSPKQTNYVFRQTKRPTAKFLNKPHVKAALDAIKSQENVARNTPSGSGRKFRSPGGKKWTELPADERQANFAERRASILAGKKQ